MEDRLINLRMEEVLHILIYKIIYQKNNILNLLILQLKRALTILHLIFQILNAINVDILLNNHSQFVLNVIVKM